MLEELDKLKTLIEDKNDITLINAFDELDKALRVYKRREKGTRLKNRMIDGYVSNSFTKEEVIEYLGLENNQEFNSLSNSGSLVRLYKGGIPYYHKEQFIDGNVFSGVAEINKYYEDDGFRILNFLLNENGVLANFRPIDVIKLGYIDKVIKSLNLQGEMGEPLVFNHEEIQFLRTLII